MLPGLTTGQVAARPPHGAALTTAQIVSLTNTQVAPPPTRCRRSRRSVARAGTGDGGGLVPAQSGRSRRASCLADNAHIGAINSALSGLRSARSPRSRRARSSPTQRQFAALSSDQIDALTTDQVAAIETTDLGAVGVAGRHHDRQLQALTTSQIRAIETLDFVALTTAQIAALGIAQLAALGTQHYAALRTDQVAALTTDQVTRSDHRAACARHAANRGVHRRSADALTSAQLQSFTTTRSFV
jgi:hypothetical protein